jgi:hypothetical protein
MSVDRAINNFMNFGSAVFGQPRLLYSISTSFRSQTKYSAANFRRAFKKVIRGGTYRESVLPARRGWGYNETIFQENSGGIRT